MPQLTIQHTFELAVQHHQAGRPAEAEKLYRQILALQPDHPGAMHYLGVIAHQAGRDDIAVDLIRRAIALNPRDAQAYSNLGTTLTNLGRFDEAIAACQQSIAIAPNYADAHYNLGLASQGGGKLDQAIAAYHRAIVLKPDFPEAHNNLGNTFHELGRLDEAVAAFRQAIAINPQYAEAFSNLGNGLMGRGQLDAAIAAFRQAIALRPQHAEAFGNLGNALKEIGSLDEAIAAYRQSIAFNPHLHTAHSNLIVAMHYHPGVDGRAIAVELDRWNRQFVEPIRTALTTPPQESFRSHSNNCEPDRRLRIGYISPDFKDHVVGRNLLPLFQQHDRQQFEIICYAQSASSDAVTDQIHKCVDGWRSIPGMNDDQVAGQIRLDKIDLLVDLTLHMANNRLLVFARKPAPVQLTFAGYPGTTGLSEIDYRLSDPYLDPPGMDESIYPERIFRLPDSFWCYDPLDCRDIAVSPLPALKSGRITFGCLNNFCKINDAVLNLWSQVLRQVQGARILMLTPEGSHRQRTADRLGQMGIDSDQIEFASPLPRREYLQQYHRIDIGLDSFPYNGHTTSLESFWMGVPVITLVGQTAVGRAGWCQLSNLDLTDLAGTTPEKFVKTATALAYDLPRLAALRSTLRTRMQQSPLMDAPKFARNIESAYRQIWRAWCHASA